MTNSTNTVPISKRIIFTKSNPHSYVTSTEGICAVRQKSTIDGSLVRALYESIVESEVSEQPSASDSKAKVAQVRYPYCKASTSVSCSAEPVRGQRQKKSFAIFNESELSQARLLKPVSDEDHVRSLTPSGRASLSETVTPNRAPMMCTNHNEKETVGRLLSSSGGRSSLRKNKSENTLWKFCDSCKCSYSDKTHMTSIAHIFTTKKPVLYPGYGIPEWNKGYQLLQSIGWDEYEGLGKNKSGHRYPIKAVVKNDKSGLGFTKEKLKAGDLHVEHVKKGSKMQTATDRERKLLKEKRMERRFRNMFRDEE